MTRIDSGKTGQLLVGPRLLTIENLGPEPVEMDDEGRVIATSNSHPFMIRIVKGEYVGPVLPELVAPSDDTLTLEDFNNAPF